MLKRTSRVAAVAATGLLAMAAPAAAGPVGTDDGAVDDAKAAAAYAGTAQDGGDAGHLPPVRENVALISSLELTNVEPEGIADVAVYGDYAYVAAWGFETCQANGVHVVDISDVGNPMEVAFIPSKEGSYPGEGVQVTSISTPSFSGDVLVTNNEICKGTAGYGGINLYDVTNPGKPTPLAVGVGDDGAGSNPNKVANETHSAFAWDAGSRAYAAIVDNEEAADVDILDITDPTKPVLVAEYDLATMFPGILQPGQGLDEVFLHDMVVEQVGRQFVMLAGYWDAGYVKLDVTDVTKPRLLADSDFADPDTAPAEHGLTVPPEGNAHYADFAGAKNAYVIGADEDFDPYAILARNSEDGRIDASTGSDTTQLTEGQTITGGSKFVGRACDGDPVPAGDGSQIAVVERGVCDFTVKVANIEAAGGYQAILVFNRTASDGCNGSLGMTVAGGIPTFGVAPREQGFAIFDEPYNDASCRAGDGTQLAPITLGATGDTLTFSSYFDGWGAVRLLDAATMTERDAYAIPEAMDPDYAEGFGDLSVHEVAVSQQNPNLSYLAYYSGGLRVIDISKRRIQEVGAFIDQGGNNFWGVETFVQDGEEYVVMSDRDKGLYILQYTG